jgi:hypothetical protein
LALSDPLRPQTTFNHLHRLHKLPVIYSATVVEVVRRKEFSTFLVEWIGRFLEVMNRFTSLEKRRRREEASESWTLLPWEMRSVFGEEARGAEIKVEISVTGGADSLAGNKLERRDVDGEPET